MALKWIAFPILILSIAGLLWWLPEKAPAHECQDCNIVLISLDSVRADRVGLLSGRNLTPNIDSFFKKGLIFENYITASYLTPISEMALHTGLYPSQSGVTGFGSLLASTTETLGERLSRAGYYNVAFGTSPEFFHFLPAVEENFSRGFDSYFVEERGAIASTTITALRSRQPSEALTWLSKRQRSEGKFFFWLALGGAHFPYGSFCSDEETYNGKLKGLSLHWNNDTLRRYYDGKVWSLTQPGMVEDILTSEDIEHIRNCYDGGIQKSDEYVGEILKALERQGFLNNTIVILQSEHGEDMGEHGTYLHYDIYNEGIHTPLFIRYPKSSAMRVSSVVESIDVLPTILDLIDVSAGGVFPGRSLLPQKGSSAEKKYAVSFRTPTWENAIGDVPMLRNLPSSYPFIDNVFPLFLQKLSQFRALAGKDVTPDLAIQSTDWKLIWRRERSPMSYSWFSTLTGKSITSPEYELYHLSVDPSEQHNVYGSYPQTEAELKAALEEFVLKYPSLPLEPQKIRPVQPYF